MDKELVDRLKKLEIEEVIWLILIIIIVLSFIANNFEREYLIYQKEKSKKEYRYLLMIIFGIALCTYLYYFFDSIKDLSNINSYREEKKKYIYLSFLSSLLIVIAGIILLYIAIMDEEIETELAFN